MNLLIKENTPDAAGRKLHYHFDGKKWVDVWDENLDASEMVMENRAQEIEPVRKQVLEGQLSPLAYHIEDKFFNLGLLSSYTKISKRHIKKHLKPENFNQLEEETLKKYAFAFGISVEELKKV
jgi:hypothetical protein